VRLAKFRKPKTTCFLSYVEYRPNTNTSKYYEKKAMLKGSHIQEREYKRRKLRR
jgi:hypothetical protein